MQLRGIRGQVSQHQCVPNIPVSGTVFVFFIQLLFLFVFECVIVFVRSQRHHHLCVPNIPLCTCVFLFFIKFVFEFEFVFVLYLYLSWSDLTATNISACPQHSSVRIETTKIPSRKNLLGCRWDGDKTVEQRFNKTLYNCAKLECLYCVKHWTGCFF